MKTAFLFSGQGSQYVGMGKELCDTFRCAAQVFECADKALGFSIQDICFTKEEILNQTEFTQPAILTASIAALRVLEEKGIHPDFVCGLSLGEYSAYVASGAMSFEDAVGLVRKRGRFMTEAVALGQGAMYAIMGLERAQVEHCCKEASAFGYVAPANYNAPGQIVIAGLVAPVEKAAQLAKEKGAKMTVRLNVSGPFHTALLEPASKQLEKELQTIEVGAMQVPVVTNVTGLIVENAQEIKPYLIKQVMQPVEWEKSIRTLVEQGVDTFVEVGPGKALSGFVKRTAKGAKILNVEDSKSLEKTLAAFTI